MALDTRQYGDEQLAEYWDSGFTIQEYSELKELPYESVRRWIRLLKQERDDSDQIRRIVDQIFTQQQAVLAPPQNFDLNIPAKGQMFLFQRDLEITDNAPLSVSFSTRKAYRFDYAEYAAFALLGLLFAGIIGFFIPRKQQKGEGNSVQPA